MTNPKEFEETVVYTFKIEVTPKLLDYRFPHVHINTVETCRYTKPRRPFGIKLKV